MNAPTATWKVVLLGLIAALLIVLGARMAWLPDPQNAVAAYQQATPCTAASIASDNCYTVVPVTVISATAFHASKRGPQEHVIVQAPSGRGEVILPWQSEQDQVLLAGATGTVDVYRGAPVNVAVGGYQFATLENPVVEKARTGSGAWLILALGVMIGGVVVLQLSGPRRGSVPLPSWDALRQPISDRPPDLDPQVVETMNEIQQRLATMQAQPQRGQITSGQTIGIVIGCGVAVLGALVLRALH